MSQKEEILEDMKDKMPFMLNEGIEPYILEAMSIHAKEFGEWKGKNGWRWLSTNKWYKWNKDNIRKTIKTTDQLYDEYCKKEEK